MPWTPPAAGVQRTPANFETPLKTFVDGVETTATSALTTAQAANTLAGTKSAKPAGGWAAADLADAAAVKHDGSVLRMVKLTQAAYSALSPKVATTFYVIVG